MAINVLEAREGRLAELLRLLMPFPGRLEFATRLALICAITTLVVEIYQTPEPALTTYLVFFLNKPDRGSTLILNIAMLALFSLIVTSVILSQQSSSISPFGAWPAWRRSRWVSSSWRRRVNSARSVELWP